MFERRDVTGRAVFRAEGSAFVPVAPVKTGGRSRRARLVNADSAVVFVEQRAPTLRRVIIDPRPTFAVALVDDDGRRLVFKRLVAEVSNELVPRRVRVKRRRFLTSARVLRFVGTVVNDCRVQLETVGGQAVKAFENAFRRNALVRPKLRTRPNERRRVVDLLEFQHFRFVPAAVARLNRVPTEPGPFRRRFLAVRADKRIRAGVIRELDLAAPVETVDHIAGFVLLVFEVNDRAADR